jgi:hypothetical protein
VITASDDFYSLFLAGAADAASDAMVTGDPPGPPANKIAAERLGLAYPFDETSQKVPLTSALAPRAVASGEREGPLTHRRCATRQARAERGGRVRGSRRRILAGFPRRNR